MPERALPSRPNLEQYRKQAKDLLRACADGDSDALLRIWHHHPRLRNSPDLESERLSLTLSDAQVVIAREHEFESWPKFATYIRSIELSNATESSRQTFHTHRFAEAIPMDGIELAAEISVPATLRGLVLFAHATGSAYTARSYSVADELHRVGIGTVLAGLLTEEEWTEDSVTEKWRFDLPLLSRRIASLTRWIGQHPSFKGVALGYLGIDTGASAALWAASYAPNIPRAVVSLGGRPDLAGPRLGYLDAPTLFVAGNKNSVLFEFTRFAFGILPPETTSDFEVIGGASHSLQEDDAFSIGVELARSWFERHLS